jgi:nucleotide-binding universal stress UspA family protein
MISWRTSVASPPTPDNAKQENHMSTFASILVHVDEADHCPHRLTIAAMLARRYGAALCAVYVEPPLVLQLYFPGEVGPALVGILEQQLREARTKALANFEALKRDHPTATWREIKISDDDFLADKIEVFGREARYADLAIVGQSISAEARRTGPGLLPEELVMETGRPVLVVPHVGQFRTVGERALVAWTDTRESARALGDAMPMLKQAKAVTLLHVSETDGSQPERARKQMARALEYLRINGITASLDIVPKGDSVSAAEMLLSRAADLDADLLVMGAYGHSRLRELVLGGATREILGSMTLPVLLAH